jgi:hypothetical protein
MSRPGGGRQWRETASHLTHARGSGCGGGPGLFVFAHCDMHAALEIARSCPAGGDAHGARPALPRSQRRCAP